MDKLEKDIEKAILKITDSDAYLRRPFSSIYPFTTENIKGYLDLLHIENKDILTVGASGDHILNLLLKSPKSIDYFDINPFTPYYVDLKISASKQLSLKDFFYFFKDNDTSDNKELSIELFNKFSDILNEESKIFWESLYKIFTPNYIRNSKLFSKDQYKLDILKNLNNYFIEENYLKLSNIKKQKHQFYESDIKFLDNKLDKSYDVILLSNIAQYLSSLEEFKKIIYGLDEHLNDGGLILICYLYDINSMTKYFNTKTMPFIYNLELLGKELKNTNLLLFDSIDIYKYSNLHYTNDAVLVYKKTK